MQAIIKFQITSGTKKRIITTYKNNEAGLKLRSEHQEIIKQLNYELFNYETTFAYLPQQNTKKLALKHLENAHFYQFDLKDFFLSIDLTILKTISRELLQDYNYDIVINQCAFSETKGLGIGLLPSPYFSNLYLLNFDQVMNKYATANNLVYTRYADDITLSSPNPVDQLTIEGVITEALTPLKLTLNQKKTHYKHLKSTGDSVKILGINIVKGKMTNYLTISRKFKKQTISETNPTKATGMKNYIDYHQNSML